MHNFFESAAPKSCPITGYRLIDPETKFNVGKPYNRSFEIVLTHYLKITAAEEAINWSESKFNPDEP